MSARPTVSSGVHELFFGIVVSSDYASSEVWVRSTALCSPVGSPALVTHLPEPPILLFTCPVNHVFFDHQYWLATRAETSSSRVSTLSHRNCTLLGDTSWRQVLNLTQVAHHRNYVVAIGTAPRVIEATLSPSALPSSVRRQVLAVALHMYPNVA